MKIQVKNYVFNKTAKTITFTDYASIDLDGILLVTNVTSNIIIYNFANPLLGGTVATNVLTLTFNTSSMADTDKVQIFYDDPAISFATPLSGASTTGQTVLTLANTWYAVPVTAPTSAYVLVATPETSVGIIRWSFDNTGTPSATNGNCAAGHLTMKLAAGQVVYFGSSSGADSVNFTTKII